MNKLVIMICGFVLSSAFTTVSHAVMKMPKGSAAAGETIAKTVCVACHNPDGNSQISTYPRLAGQHPKYIYKQLTDFKHGTRLNNEMKPQADALSDQQMADLAVYFSTQKARVDLSKGGDSFVRGERLFRGGDATRGIVPCAGCHGGAGKGNEFALFPRIGGQHADYIVVQLRTFRAAGRGDIVDFENKKRTNDEKGMMQAVASKLSDQDVLDLANFIAGLYY